MPIIEIRTLPFSKSFDIPEILKRLNAEAASAMNIEERHVWSYWEFIEAHQYAVGSQTSECLTVDTHSPVVKVIAFEGKSTEAAEKLLETIARVLAEELEIDIANIFVYYQTVSSGNVFDGGQIVRKK
ncbi:MAG: hypothetical protein IAE90_02485 [Ignavibacteria bacterium]|nr:hypothetical protein [Ignavibacteria bacterium]